LANELAAERDGRARQNQPQNAKRQAGVKRERKVGHEMRQHDDCNEEAQPGDQKALQQPVSTISFHDRFTLYHKVKPRSTIRRLLKGEQPAAADAVCRA